MTALQRIAAILHRARVDGGWDDDTVAATILAALGLDEDGQRIIDELPAPPS